MIRNVPNLENFEIREIRACDCFFDMGICLMKYLAKLDDCREITDVFNDVISHTQYPQDKMYVLLSKISGVCCAKVL